MRHISHCGKKSLTSVHLTHLLFSLNAFPVCSRDPHPAAEPRVFGRGTRSKPVTCSSVTTHVGVLRTSVSDGVCLRPTLSSPRC